MASDRCTENLPYKRVIKGEEEMAYYRSILFAFSLLGLAAIGRAEEPAEPRGVSVADFLTSDGQIDLEAAQRAGFESSLSLEGFDVRIDPETGEPAVFPASAGNSNSDSDDQYWHDLSSVPDVGMNDYVYSLTVYNDDLIAGGWFTTAGGESAN